jgi:transposase
MDTSIALSEGRRRRRKHSDEFKAHIVAACCKPGVSSASVAMANGINANLVRRWVKEVETGPEREPDGVTVKAAIAKPPAGAPTKFLPIPLPTPVANSDIRIEVQRGSTTVVVTWPAAVATECAAWLRELLR